MIRVEVIEKFDLERFDELKNIKRARNDVKGSLFVGDTFECSQDLVEYLTGGNRLGRAFVKVIEIEPEITEEQVQAVAIAMVEQANEEEKPVENIINKIVEEAVEEGFEKPKKKKSKK